MKPSSDHWVSSASFNYQMQRQVTTWIFMNRWRVSLTQNIKTVVCSYVCYGPSINNFHMEGERWVELRWTPANGRWSKRYVDVHTENHSLLTSWYIFFSCKEVGDFWSRISSLGGIKSRIFFSIETRMTGQNGRPIGQNGTDKMVAIFIDSNSTELNFYSVTTSHK